MRSKLIESLLIVLAFSACKAQRSELQDVNEAFVPKFRDCTAEVKEQMTNRATLSLMKPFLPSDFDYESILGTGNVTRELFSQSYLVEANITGQSLAYEVRQGEDLVYVDDELNVSDDEVPTDAGIETSLLVREISYVGWRNGKPVNRVDVSFRVDYPVDCAQRPAESTLIVYQPKDGDNFAINFSAKDLMTGRDTNSGVIEASLSALKNSNLRVNELQKFSPGEFVPMVLGTLMGGVAISKKESAEVRLPSGELAPATILVAEYNIGEATVPLRATIAGDHYAKMSLLGLSTTEVVSAELWQGQRLAERPVDKRGKAKNFAPGDFTFENLSYTVHTDHELAFDNYPAYFTMQKIDPTDSKFRYQVAARKARAPQGIERPFPPQVGREHQPYLRGTRLINTADPRIAAMADRVRDRVGNRSQALVLMEILFEVNAAISYDYDALGQQNINIASVKDTLDSGLGVCQHFSAVFVAVARSIGIPARIVVGGLLSYDLDKNEPSAGYHAWVEVLINGRDWLPLEPQSTSYFLRYPATYFPFGVARAYEQEDQVNHADLDFGVLAASVVFEGTSPPFESIGAGEIYPSNNPNPYDETIPNESLPANAPLPPDASNQPY